MSVRLFVKLQTPTIELKVSARDAAGKTDSFLVGFKRYELEEAEKKIKVLQELWSTSIKEDASNSDKNAFDVFVKDEIVYLKSVELNLTDEKGIEKKLTVNDTRTVKPLESLWEGPDECLPILLDAYLASAPYRLSLLSGLQKALLNNDFSEAEVKNS